MNTDGTGYENLHRFPDNSWSATLTLVGDTLYGTTNKGGDSDYGTIFAIPIPEPSTVVLSAVGLAAAMIAFRRRKRRR